MWLQTGGGSQGVAATAKNTIDGQLNLPDPSTGPKPEVLVQQFTQKVQVCRTSCCAAWPAGSLLVPWSIHAKAPATLLDQPLTCRSKSGAPTVSGHAACAVPCCRKARLQQQGLTRVHACAAHFRRRRCRARAPRL